MNASDKLLAAMTKHTEEVARLQKAEVARLTELGNNVEAAVEEMVRVTVPRLEALAERPPAGEEGRNMVRAVFREALHDMKTDPQRDPAFREAVALLEEQMAEELAAR